MTWFEIRYWNNAYRTCEFFPTSYFTAQARLEELTERGIAAALHEITCDENPFAEFITLANSECVGVVMTSEEPMR